MTIQCSHCGVILTSLILDREMQFRDIFIQLERHVLKNHTAEAKEALGLNVQKLYLLCTTYMFLVTFAVIPKSETALADTFEKTREGILEIMGIEVDEVLEPEEVEDDEEDFEDEDEDDDTEEIEPLEMEPIQKEENLTSPPN